MASNEINNKTQFVAGCKDRNFELNLSEDTNFQTLFQTFSLSDGVLNAKKLTERERLIKTLETHMGIEVLQ